MEKNFKFKTDIRVRYSETDMAGVVNNINFFRYFEIARTEYWRTAGIIVMDVLKRGLDVVMVHQECDYKQPVYFDEILEIGVRTGEIGDSSFTIDYRILRKATGEEVAAGKTVHVMLDVSSRKPCPAPDWARDILLNFENS